MYLFGLCFQQFSRFPLSELNFVSQFFLLFRSDVEIYYVLGGVCDIGRNFLYYDHLDFPNSDMGVVVYFDQDLQFLPRWVVVY